MKKFGIFLLVLLLLCTGCASKTTAPLLQDADAVRVNHAVMIPDYYGQPQETYTGKICTGALDVAAIVKALQAAKIGEETDTIYGGETALILLYCDDMEIAWLRMSLDGKWVCIDNAYYPCSHVPNLEKLYDSLSAKEADIVIA